MIISKGFFLFNILRVLLLFFGVISLSCARADSSIRLSRVFDLNSMPSTCRIGIVGEGLNGQYWAMSNQRKGKKQTAEAVTLDANSLSVSENSLWQLTFYSDDSVTLQSLQDGYYLGVADLNSTDLCLNDLPYYFSLKQSEEGHFCFHHAEQTKRALGVADSKSFALFGYYTQSYCDTWHLRIYIDQTSLESSVPQISSSTTEVGAMVENALIKFSGNQFQKIDASNYLLNNQTLAFDDFLQTWQVEWKSDSTFNLISKEGFSFMDAIGAEKTCLKLGKSCYTTDEEDSRFLVSTPDSVICLTSQPDWAIHRPVYFLAKGKEPEISNDADGSTTLIGAWTKTALENLSWEGVNALDLTNLSLPVAPFEWKYREISPNAFIFINDEGDILSENAYFDNWSLVVRCDENGENQLIRGGYLTDKFTFYTPRSFRVSKGQLSYTRTLFGDGAWETLYLPFVGIAPDGFQFLSFESLDESGLTFTEINSWNAYHPVLFKPTSENMNTNSITLSCDDEEIMPTPFEVYEKDTPFFGTLSPMTISSDDMNVFLLHPSGKEFVKAANGSYLAPFRAGIFAATTYQTLPILRDLNATGIDVAFDVENQSKNYYNLNGIRLNPNQLPFEKGIYLQGNCKYIKIK